MFLWKMAQFLCSKCIIVRFSEIDIVYFLLSPERVKSLFLVLQLLPILVYYLLHI